MEGGRESGRVEERREGEEARERGKERREGEGRIALYSNNRL